MARVHYGCILMLCFAATSAGAAPPVHVTKELKDVLPVMIQVNRAMVNIGKVAQDRANRDDVADYAERLWRDHQFALKKLRHLAVEQAIAMEPTAKPPAALRKLRTALSELRKAPDPRFDAKFVTTMATVQQRMKRQLSSALRIAPDPDAQVLFNRLIPIVDQHIELAEYVGRELKRESP